MTKTTLIVDADLLIYRCAAAAEKRTILATHKNSGRSKEFKTRTEMKKFLKDNSIEYKEEDYEIRDIQHPENISNAISTVKKIVGKMQDFTWADSIEYYLGEGKVFRHFLPLPSPYKNNRAELLKPIHLAELREWSMEHLGAKLVKEIEADDEITIRAYEELQAGNRPILSSLDKDCQQTQEVEIFNWTEDKWILKKIPVVGELCTDKTAVKGDGLKFLALQVLSGDLADTYKPYELSDVRYGPKKAKAALDPCETEQEILNAVISEYKRLYPSEFSYTDCHGVEHSNVTWKDILQLYWSCAYMLRSRNDPCSNFEYFANQKGVNL